MTTADLLHETYSALSANKVRSGLTVLGIVIGISSVITMISIGNGAQASVSASIQSIGSNLVMVQPGAQRGPGATVSTGRGGAQSLTLEDANAIAAQVANAQYVAPIVQARKQIVARGTNTNTSIYGITPAYASVRDIQVEEGQFISDANNKSLAKVAVLGPTTRNDLFGADGEAVGQSIRIGSLQFTIIGVTVSKGGSGFTNQDDAIYIPLSTDQLFIQGDQYLSSISISASTADATTQVQNDVTALLLDRHHISDPTLADFSTVNQADILATASSITQIFTILLASIAGISLVVGGIGIMNMMLTTVTERTREIGLRKAIGATKRDISMQFLAEAIVLTLIGGIVGVALGWCICAILSTFNVINTQLSFMSIALSFGVSAFIGIVFGYYPAARAASLNPIEALRYE